MLQDLHQVALDCQRRYQDEFDDNDFILSLDFKKAFGSYLRSLGQDVDFSPYTAIVTTSGNLKMYIPNQWFAAAAYMIPFIQEYIKYRSHVLKILANTFSSKDLKDYFAVLKSSSDRSDAEAFRARAQKFLKGNIPDVDLAKTVEYLTKFVSDYDWWFGNKTIDRGDSYVSPVLALLLVVNVSQAYIADISYMIATVPSLSTVAERMVAKNSGELSAVKERPTSTFITRPPRLTGGTNEIVYGAHGTGKSRFLEDKYGGLPYTRRVVFHPEYSYFDFIGTYKPVPVYRESKEIFRNIDGSPTGRSEPYIDYRFVSGPFVNAMVNAWLNPEHMWTLLIEEINRANAAAVFGEAFQLLDRAVDGTSEYALSPPEDLNNYLLSIPRMNAYLADGLKMPSNLNLVATMNSADEGVKPIDSAFKRRWNYKYLKINISGAVHEKAVLMYAGNYVYWGRLVEKINAKLAGGVIGLDEDRLIGPYFIRPQEVGKRSAADKLLLYLWDDALRHNREAFFSNSIHIFSDLSDKFEREDVLDLGGDNLVAIGAPTPGTAEQGESGKSEATNTDE